jgi:hypothetical protein
MRVDDDNDDAPEANFSNVNARNLLGLLGIDPENDNGLCGEIPHGQIANVRLENRGRGAQADSQLIGWLARFFLSVLPI